MRYEPPKSSEETPPKQGGLEPTECDTATGAPGWVGMHRLNGAELDNTLRDVLGIKSRPSGSLPPGGTGHTFDNDAAAQASTTAELIEKYLNVFEGVVDEAFTTSRAQIVTCSPTQMGAAACARQIFQRMGERLYRRPLETAELEKLVTLSQTVTPFDDGVKLGLRALLSSPSFLFRLIAHPEPDSTTSLHALTDFELATRVSYFLWGSTPDETLLTHARAGRLKEAATLRAEVQRMLKDPRAQWLIDSMATQWLKLDRIPGHAADPAVFPEFTTDLRADMLTEARMLVQDMIASDAAVLSLLTADHTFVNARLAEYYGMSGVTGTQFREVSLSGTNRRGLVTQAGILAMNSRAEKTSIARRGQWVLSQLLCTPPPAAPPNVPAESVPPGFEGTRRELAEMHRSNPACSGCHLMMDPIGFGLEDFDAVGRHRTEENDKPIDSSGELPDGTRFSGALELITFLEQSRSYNACAAQQFLSFAVGREPTSEDRCAARKIADAYVTPTTPFSEFIFGLVSSQPFTMQRGGGPRTMTFRLSRRTFLRGQGALIALPFLEAMLPSRAHAQTAAPVRYALLYFPNGTTADWAPGTTGTNYQLTSVMAGLQPFKADITVCTNVHNPTASYHPGHATGFAVGKSPPPSGAPFNAAVSVDQYIANAIGSKTRVKSLAMTPPGNGNSESGQSGVYGSNLSWVSATTPAARSVSPREIFETLMAGATPGQPQPSGVDERIARQKSVLDFVLFDANRLRTKLGSTDRATLDQFLTNVREVEQKLSATPPPPPSSEPAACGAGTRPNDSYPFEQDLRAQA